MRFPKSKKGFKHCVKRGTLPRNVLARQANQRQAEAFRKQTDAMNALRPIFGWLF